VGALRAIVGGRSRIAAESDLANHTAPVEGAEACEWQSREGSVELLAGAELVGLRQGG
jgi:hypothetical protein